MSILFLLDLTEYIFILFLLLLYCKTFFYIKNSLLDTKSLKKGVYIISLIFILSLFCSIKFIISREYYFLAIFNTIFFLNISLLLYVKNKFNELYLDTFKKISDYNDDKNLNSSCKYEMSKIKHDLKNHIIAYNKNFLDENKISDFLDEIFLKFDGYKIISTSGNSVVDNIINDKLSKIYSLCTLNVQVHIPPFFDKISDFDLAIILGNLLDNSIRAISETKEDKFFILKIEYIKGRLYIHIQNSFEKLLKKKDGSYVSTKENNKNHGFGLKNILETVKKYDGVMEITNTENIFCVDILLFL